MFGIEKNRKVTNLNQHLAATCCGAETFGTHKRIGGIVLGECRP